MPLKKSQIILLTNLKNICTFWSFLNLFLKKTKVHVHKDILYIT